MSSKWSRKFYALCASLADEQEAKLLFESLLSPKEQEEFAHRLHILSLLHEGQSQRSVRDQAKVSIATVTRGARVLRERGAALSKLIARIL